MGLFRAFGWALYDHLWGVIGLNLLWTALSLPWLAAALLLGSLGLSLEGELAWWGAVAGMLLGAELALFSPPGVLLFAAARRWAQERPVELRDLWREALPFAWRAQLLGLLVGALTLILMVNILFYQRLGGWVGLILSGAMLWLLLALLLTAVFLFPVLLALDRRLWAVVRQSFLLALDNLGPALGLLVASLCFIVGSAFTGAGLFCGGLASLALLLSLAFRRLCRKYTGEAAPAEGPRRWRELIRPWEH
ncbi:MAG: hypothetical protein FJY95_12320 [Candidatus Handelsmanbacteria bacterium]|nr:hypothetical protein [Candidatus Handelsmanbacteria bacterium]